MKIAVLPGDGIGPETTRVALSVLAVAGDVYGFSAEVTEHPFGGNAIDSHNDPFPAETRAALPLADAVLKGAVGGPSGIRARFARSRASWLSEPS